MNKIHVAFVVPQRNPTNRSFILANAREPFVTSTKIGGLTTWLAHSKKKSCDVCKHAYSFTKVYDPDMPIRLPPVLLIRRLAQQSLLAVLFVIRGIAVAIIWLAVLPWVTVWTWRMYFSMGESTAWWISDRPRFPSSQDAKPLGYYNMTAANLNGPVTPSQDTYFGTLLSHPVLVAISADIFTGQIIASIIVLTFVVMFLLREWISQNARPGVFEDEEIPPAERQEPVQAPPPPQPEPQLPPPVLNEPVPATMDQANVPPTDNRPKPRPQNPAQRKAVSAHEIDNGHIVGDSHHARRLHRPHLKPTALKGKGKLAVPRRASVDAHARARRRRKSSEDSTSTNGLPEYDGSRKRTVSRRPYSRNENRQIAESSSTPRAAENSVIQAEAENFEFTFRATARLPRRSVSEPASERPPRTDSITSLEQADQTSVSFPHVDLVPPVSSIPFSFQRDESTPRARQADSLHTPFSTSLPQDDPVDPIPGPLKSTQPASSFSAAGPHGAPRRPPLPTMTLPASGSSTPTSANGTFTPGSMDKGTPMASPSLVTYRAPEELEAGPSRLSGYFDPTSTSVDPDYASAKAIQREHEKYFQEPPKNSKKRHAEEELERTYGEEADAEHDAHVEAEENEWEMRAFDEYELEDDEEERMDNDDEEEDDDDDEEDQDMGEGDWDGDAAPVGQAANRPAEAVVVVAAPIQEAPPEVAPIVEGNDDLEGNPEDDMDGAMEAIGMRGPIFGVVQNAGLMIFVLDTAIGLGVWIPFTIGKSAALLSLDPHRFLQILHLPIRAMRIITDPIVDSVVFLLAQFVLPYILRLAQSVAHASLDFVLFFSEKLCGKSRSSKSIQYFNVAYTQVTEYVGKVQMETFSWTSSSSTNATVSSPSVIDEYFPKLALRAEPYFAILGAAVRVRSEQLQVTWKRLALGHGPTEKAFAVILGYLVVGLLLSLYLNILTVGNVRSAGRAVRSALRQQLLVLKVAAFIFIELVSFPLGCGIVLDLCTVWLFPEANMLSRAVFFYQSPLTAMFYHWVAGTMFMYSFAILLSGCRSLMRPGAMWFIKDPQDQNSHPIRDILDRPTITQLRKIFVSGLMYSFVVACVVGSVAGLVTLGNKSIMPFRWRNRQPLSQVPLDLLFLHSVLPYTMRYFRPKKVLRIVSLSLWKFLAARLRLSSYFFGNRYAEEEYTPNRSSWISIYSRPTVDVADPSNVHDGSFRRVPKTDHVALTREMRATAAVNEDGSPVDDHARGLIQAQIIEAEKAKRNPAEDYTVVYIPPNFRRRIMLFITSLWIIGAICLGFLVAVPIMLGRRTFALFIPQEVHDGYSFIAGFYLLWACYLVGKSVDRLDKRRQRKGGQQPRANLFLLAVKRGLLWIVKISYMLFFLGIVIPTLIAIVMDLYIVLPIRLTVDPFLVPRIRIVDSWAIGLLYANIALHIHRLHQPPNRLTIALHNIAANGWTHPDPTTATKELIMPISGGLIGMIVLPAVIFHTLCHLMPFLHLDGRFIFMHVYPSIFAIAGICRGAIVSLDRLRIWSQTVRDKEFLVEMRLRNLEPQMEKEDEEKEEDDAHLEFADHLM